MTYPDLGAERLTAPDPETRALPTAAYAVNGIATVAIGVMVLVWPDETLAVVAALFGIHLLLVGVVQLVGAVRSPASVGVRVALAVLGLLAAGAGIVCLLSPFTSLGVLVLFIAIGWFSEAVADVVAGTRAEGSRRLGLWLLALVSAAGATALLVWPSLSLHVLVWVAGWTLVVLGVAQLVSLVAHRDSRA